MKKENEFVLPEKWGIIGCKELKEYFHEIKIDHILDGNYDNQVYYINDMDDKWDCELIAYKDGETEIISFEQFKEHVLKDIPKPEYEPKDVAFNNEFETKCGWNKMNEYPKPPNKIIGYKLIKPEYKKAVNTMFDFDYMQQNYILKFSDSLDSENLLKLQKAGVLPIWFEEVYEKEQITLKSGVKLSEDDIAEVKEILKNK